LEEFRRNFKQNKGKVGKVMESLAIYDKVKNVPENAKKPITGGRLKGKTDINPMWRIKTLTEQFGAVGFGWYTEIIKQWQEIGSGGEIASFVNINLFIKSGNEWSKPIVGTGGSMFVANESKGAFTSDECYKMAYTDAISVACKALGMGADVYWASDRTKYDTKPEAKPEVKQPKTEAKVLVDDAIGAKLQVDWNSYLTKYKVYGLNDLTSKQLDEIRKELGL
jgi:hypothetical protein